MLKMSIKESKKSNSIEKLIKIDIFINLDHFLNLIEFERFNWIWIRICRNDTDSYYEFWSKNQLNNDLNPIPVEIKA